MELKETVKEPVKEPVMAGIELVAGYLSIKSTLHAMIDFYKNDVRFKKRK